MLWPIPSRARELGAVIGIGAFAVQECTYYFPSPIPSSCSPVSDTSGPVFVFCYFYGELSPSRF